jgi:hypothetical protein
MTRKDERRPTRQPTTDSNGVGLTIDGALVILSLLKETSEALPPLKAVSAGALALLESVKVGL